MTKQEFLDRIKQEKPLEGTGMRIKVDMLLDSPDIIGCFKDNDGLWKIYETMERGGYYFIDEAENEDEAYNKLYEQVYVQKELSNYGKHK